MVCFVWKKFYVLTIIGELLLHLLIVGTSLQTCFSEEFLLQSGSNHLVLCVNSIPSLKSSKKQMNVFCHNAKKAKFYYCFLWFYSASFRPPDENIILSLQRWCLSSQDWSSYFVLFMILVYIFAQPTAHIHKTWKKCKA